MDLKSMLDEEKVEDLERLLRETLRSDPTKPDVWRFPELPGWRIHRGHAAHFGLRPYPHEDGKLRVGPGSLALSDLEDGAGFGQESVQKAWEHWTRYEREVYVDAREEAIAMASSWGAGIATDPDVRLLAAQFAVGRVVAFRVWYLALQGSPGKIPPPGSPVASAGASVRVGGRRSGKA